MNAASETCGIRTMASRLNCIRVKRWEDYVEKRIQKSAKANWQKYLRERAANFHLTSKRGSFGGQSQIQRLMNRTALKFAANSGAVHKTSWNIKASLFKILCGIWNGGSTWIQFEASYPFSVSAQFKCDFWTCVQVRVGEKKLRSELVGLLGSLIPNVRKFHKGGGFECRNVSECFLEDGLGEIRVDR
jgi:hypothetical protein